MRAELLRVLADAVHHRPQEREHVRVENRLVAVVETSCPGERTKLECSAAFGLEGAADKLLEPLKGKRLGHGGRVTPLAADGCTGGDESNSGREKGDIAPGGSQALKRLGAWARSGPPYSDG